MGWKCEKKENDKSAKRWIFSSDLKEDNEELLTERVRWYRITLKRH